MRIGNVSLDGRKLQLAQELFGFFASAFNSEAKDSAGAVRQVLLNYVMIGISGKVGIVYPGYLRMILKELCDLKGVLRMTLYSYVKALKSELQKI